MNDRRSIATILPGNMTNEVAIWQELTDDWIVLFSARQPGLTNTKNVNVLVSDEAINGY